MPVIFVNRFYWPDETATGQLLTDLAEGLAGRGRAVTVIASRPPGALRSEIRHGVRIERVRGTRWGGKGSAPGKAADFAAFHLAALGRLLRLARPGDRVVALTDPPLIGVGAVLAARLRRAACFHWVQDIYPEIALALGGPRLLGGLRRPRDWAWRRADACVTLGAAMARSLAAAGVPPARLHVVPNWSVSGAPPSGSVEARRRAWGLEGKFVAEYSGNLGRVHELGAVLAAAEALREDKDIVFLFVGGGARRREVEAEAARRGLERIAWQPAQPRAGLAAAIGAGDAHWITLRPGCEDYVYPSKLYGVAAAGRPAVFVGPTGSEPARTITAAGIGFAFAPDDRAGIADCLRRLSRDPAERERIGARAREFAAAAPLASAIATWDRLLENGRAR